MPLKAPDLSLSDPFCPIQRRSQNHSSCGSHQQPPSVAQNLRFGNRSNTPDQSMNHMGRAGHQVTSVT